MNFLRNDLLGIHEMTEMTNTANIVQVVMGEHLKWLGCVERMPNQTNAKITNCWKEREGKSQGREKMAAVSKVGLKANKHK